MKRLNLLIKSLCFCLLFLFANQQSMAQVSAILQKSANVPTGVISSGHIFTYTLTFSIVGTGTASGVTLSDNIPAPLEIVGSVVGGSGVVTLGAATALGTPVSVYYASLPAGTIKQVQINVRFPEGKTCDGTVVKNQAVLTIKQPEFAVRSNEVVTTASAANKMTIEKSFEWSNGVDGNTVWKIAIINPSGGNYGGYNLTGINLADALPTGANFVSLTDHLGATVPITGNANWLPTDMTVSPYYYQRIYYLTVNYTSPTFGNNSSVTNIATLTAQTPCNTPVTLTSSKTITLVKSTLQGIGLLTKTMTQGGLGTTFSPGCTGAYNIRFVNNASPLGGPASTITNFALEDDVPSQTQITGIVTPSTPVCSKLEYWVASVCGGVGVLQPAITNPILMSPTIPASQFVTKVRWTYNSVPAGTIINTKLNFTITTCGGLIPLQTVTNTVKATGATTAGAYGPVIAENKVKAADFSPKIALSKVLSNCSYGFPYLATAPNNKARFRLVIANYGNQDAVNCVIKDVLPAGLTYAGNEKYLYINTNWPINVPCSAFSATFPTAVGLTSMNTAATTTNLQWNLAQMPYMCGNTPQYFCIEFDVNITDYPALGYYTNTFNFQAPNYNSNAISTSNTAYLPVNGIVSARAEKLVRNETGVFANSANLPAGATLRYKLKLINDAGSLPLRSMRLIDILPYNGDVLVVVPTISRGSTTNATLGTALNLATVNIPATPTTTYNTSLGCRNSAPSSLNIPVDLTGCNPLWVAAPTAPNNGAVRMDWGAATALLPNVTAEVMFDAALSATAQQGQMACNSFGFGFIPLNTGMLIATEPTKVCVTTTTSCCDKAKINPTPESCCSQLQVSGECAVKSIKVDLMGGKFTALNWTCGPVAAGYVGSQSVVLNATSPCYNAIVNPCFEATGLGTVTITYTITFVDGTTCVKSETKKCCCTPKITVPTSGCSGIAMAFVVDTVNCKFTNGRWDFGDGTTSNVVNTTHVYNAIGSYTAVFYYINDCGEQKIGFPIGIEQCPCEVKPCFNYKSNSLAAQFYSNSTSNYPIVAYHWNFGDGSWANGQNPVHTYTVGGVYKVCLTVYVDNGMGLCDCLTDANTICMEVTIKAGANLSGTNCPQFVQPNPPTTPNTSFSTSRKMMAYPNPVSNNLTVVFDKQVSDTEGSSSQLEIYNLQGQLVKKQALDAGLDETKISMQQLQTGTYILSLRQNGQVISTVKVTKN
jgi:uncharacterized repeat protein (TIGR01451 family)